MNNCEITPLGMSLANFNFVYHRTIIRTEMKRKEIPL